MNQQGFSFKLGRLILQGKGRTVPMLAIILAVIAIGGAILTLAEADIRWIAAFLFPTTAVLLILTAYSIKCEYARDNNNDDSEGERGL